MTPSVGRAGSRKYSATHSAFQPAVANYMIYEMTGHDIGMPDLEQVFSRPDEQIRFARFCNSVIVATSRHPLPSFPRLDDAPGPDGGFDGTWTLLDEPASANAAPFAVPGWNAFQYKARSSANGPGPAFASLKQSVRGCLQALIVRAGRPRELRRYTLFTNLRLGRPHASRSSDGEREYAARRDELIAAMREGLASDETIAVEIFGAAELQAAVNSNPALRETFFGPQLFQPWEDSWRLLEAQKHGGEILPFIGRDPLVKDLLALVGDPTVGFVGVSGGSGMGKSRLVLEATRPSAPATFFVRAGAKPAFFGKDLSVYRSESRVIFVVEDIRRDEAKQLAEQAVLHPGICIVATIPAEEHLPRLRLGDSPGIRHVHVPPLKPDDAKALIEATGAKLDHEAAEWLVQEAGGNPQIILAATDLGAELRQKKGLLKKQVAQSFLARAEALFGSGVVPVLEALSVFSPFDIRKEKHLETVCACFGLKVDAAAIRNLREPLENAGFLESSGRARRELNVSPPLLAAFLTERLLEGNSSRGFSLFQQIDSDGRERLLDRLVSVDSGDAHSLWTYVFGSQGPFATTAALDQNITALRSVARAAPQQTAAFLAARHVEVLALLHREKQKLGSLTELLADSSRSESNQRIDGFRSWMQTILHELVYHTESSRDALGLLEKIAVADGETGSGFGKLFVECFVVWYYRFPVRPSERWPVIVRLLQSKDPKEGKVGHQALFDITDPPHTLSGQVVQRRRMGEIPPTLTWTEVWEYFIGAFDLHLNLATTSGEFRNQANERLRGALAELKRLPPARTMPLLRRVTGAFFAHKLTLAPVRLLDFLNDTRERFDEALAKYPSAEWTVGIPNFNAELDALINRIQGGPPALRLAVWADSNPSVGWEEVAGTGKHRYEVELDQLATEVVQKPKLLTPAVRAVLLSPDALHGPDFARFLGARDRQKACWRRMSILRENPRGVFVFAGYCRGIAEHDRRFVESQLDEAMSSADGNLLVVLKVLGPTASNRRRLLAMIKSKKVTPREVANMFTSGLWLPKLPAQEVARILRYVGKDRTAVGVYELLQVLSLYLHSTKTLRPVLFPIARSVLWLPCQYQMDTDIDRDRVGMLLAKANAERALELFEKLMHRILKIAWSRRSACYNPLNGPDTTMEFYRCLAVKRPARTYAAALRYLSSQSRLDRLDDDTRLFDLERDASIVLRLVKGNSKLAQGLAGNLLPEQKGFWPVVFALLALFPDNVRLRRTLMALFDEDSAWGYDSGRLAAGLTLLETGLLAAEIPAHGRAFIEETKALLIRRRGEVAVREEAAAT